MLEQVGQLWDVVVHVQVLVQVPVLENVMGAVLEVARIAALAVANIAAMPSALIQAFDYDYNGGTF